MHPEHGHESFGAILRARFGDGAENVPAWLTTSLVVIAVLYMFSQIMLTYTHGSVIATLAMIEDTSPTPYAISAPPAYTDDVPSDDKNADVKTDAPLPPAYREDEQRLLGADTADEAATAAIALVTTKPVTASNRGAVRHLRRYGGRGATVRGLGVALLHGFLTHCISNLFYWAIGGHAGAAIGFVAAQVMLYRVNMLWTHLVISGPSTKRVWQRLVPRSEAKRVLLPTLAWALAHLAISFILVQLTFALGFDRPQTHEPHMAMHHGMPIHARMNAGHTMGPMCQGAYGSDAHKHMCGCMMMMRPYVLALLKPLVLIVAIFSLIVFVYVPFNVALTRCQAALLAEDETPLISFDPTFGGRTAVTTVNAKGRTVRVWGMLEAWRSFDWNARVRLFKVYARTIAYQALSTFLFGALAFVAVVAWLTAEH